MSEEEEEEEDIIIQKLDLSPTKVVEYHIYTVTAAMTGIRYVDTRNMYYSGIAIIVIIIVTIMIII